MGEDRHEELDGYTVDFMSFGQGGDLSQMLEGLPDDRCQCPHWGYVFKGSITMRFADRDEVYSAGDAVYIPPGHTPTYEAGTEFVQFCPTDGLQLTMAAIMKNMQAMQGG
jgi:hypothetical protein